MGYKGNITRDATYQIERIIKEMEKGKYKQMSDSLVAVKLKLLIHMVPDMHCPCHIGYAKELGLKGGSIYVNGKKVGRHKFWDGAPMRMHPKWKGADRFVQAYDTYSEKQQKKICKGILPSGVFRMPARWSRFIWEPAPSSRS